MVKIDKGIEYRPKNSANQKYPWGNMEVGDSFLVEPSESGVDALQNSISALGRIAGKKYGMVYRSQRQPGGKVRVWRVA